MSRHVDDPTTINAFLRMIRATPLSASPNARPEAMAQTVPPAPLNGYSHESGVGNEPPETWTAPDGTSTSVEASPAREPLAPPPTPETQPVTNGSITLLEPIFEDDSDSSNGAKQIPAKTGNPECTERTSSAQNEEPQVSNVLDTVPHALTPTQYALLVKTRNDIAEAEKARIIKATRDRAARYIDETVEKFRQSKAAMFAAVERPVRQEVPHVATDGNQETGIAGPFPSPKPVESPEAPVSVAGLHLSDDDSPIHRMQNPTIKDEAMLTVQDRTVRERIQSSDEPLLGAPTQGSILLQDTNSSETIATAKADTKGSGRQYNEDENGYEGSDESSGQERENLTHFKSWGNPTARNQPSARVRKIILTGLPPKTDLTVVQSLIHGGAVEHMGLSPPSPETRTLTAHVTFVSADACDRFFDKYPNGIDLRHQSKQCPITVEKGTTADVLSGMMQGYLECGATRVLQVSLVDDDWGIVALHKLAEGKQKVRQVEAVVDMYHNENRTVTFRFASITHAVQFKGVLIRSHDFEGCPVAFALDPCSIATDFHYT
ncbi:hypothetical protein LTS17_000297 [Exophiala oligosperma]